MRCVSAFFMATALAFSLLGCEAVGNDCIESTCEEFCRDFNWNYGSCDGDECTCSLEGGDGDSDADCDASDDCDSESVCVSRRCMSPFGLNYDIIVERAYSISTTNAADEEWDWYGLPDPYVVVNVDDIAFESSIIENQTSPTWNEVVGTTPIFDSAVASWELREDDVTSSELITHGYFDLTRANLKDGEFTFFDGPMSLSFRFDR